MSFPLNPSYGNCEAKFSKNFKRIGMRCVHFDHVTSFIVNPDDAPVTIIEIRPFRNGWQVYEAPDVQPVFLNQEQAIRHWARLLSLR